MNFTEVEELQEHWTSCELMDAGYAPIIAAISPYLEGED
jgi:hypothetical protein